MTSEPAKVSKKTADSSSPSAPDSVELRIRRLEEAVAGLQDTRQIEDRVVERVSDKFDSTSGQRIRESSGFLAEAGRHILPAALGLSSESFGGSSTNAPGTAPARRAWWLFEAYDDLRSMVRMYFDQRYRRHMTWGAFLTPFVLVSCVLLVWFWMPTSIPFVGWALAVLDRIIDVLLAFFAYKILSRELIRYRQMMAGYSR